MGINMTMRVRLRGPPKAFDPGKEFDRLRAALFREDVGLRLVDKVFLYDDWDKSHYAVRPEGETWVEVDPSDLGRHYAIGYERGSFLLPYLVWRWFKANHDLLGVIVCSDMGGTDTDTTPEEMEATLDHWMRVQNEPYQKAFR